MQTYTPDAWVIIEVDSPEHGKISKILAGWYGGFGGSNSWKISSGIVDFVQHKDYVNVVYKSLQHSGSSYVLFAGSERLTALTAGILSEYQEKLSEIGATMQVVDSGDYLRGRS